MMYGWFYGMINSWWFSIPSGNDDLLAKIAEKEMNLEQQTKRYDYKPVFCIFFLEKDTEKNFAK